MCRGRACLPKLPSPSPHNLSVMSECRIDVVRSRRLSVGHHSGGRFLSSTAPIGGFGRVNSAVLGVKPKTSEPQSTPAFEPVRVRLRVCAPAFRSCLARFVSSRRPPQTLPDDESSSSHAQLQVRSNIACCVALFDPQHFQLPQKSLLELVRAVDENLGLALGKPRIACLEALHQEPGCFSCENLDLLGGPSDISRNVVDNIACKLGAGMTPFPGVSLQPGRMVPKSGALVCQAHQQASNRLGKLVL